MVEVIAEDEYITGNRGVWNQSEGDTVLIVCVVGGGEVGGCCGGAVGKAWSKCMSTYCRGSDLTYRDNSGPGH